MKKTKEKCNVTDKPRQEDAHPDASGFIQNHPDASGFVSGKQPEKPDGKWHSGFPDAHGWHHSSTE